MHDALSTVAELLGICQFSYLQDIAPGAARRYAPVDGSSIQKSRRIYVRPRTVGPQSAHLWWSAVAKLQAVIVPIAWAAAPLD